MTRILRVVATLIAIVLTSKLTPAAQSAVGTWDEMLAQANALFSSKQKDSALVVARLAYEEALRANGESDSSVAMTLHRLSGIAFDLTKPDAETLLRKAVAAWDKVASPNPLERAKTLSNFGGYLLATLQFDEAEKILSECLEIRLKLYPQNDPEIARTLQRLGQLETGRNRPVEARDYFVRTAEIYKQHLPKRAHELSQALNQAGLAAFTMGLHIDAKNYFTEAISHASHGPGESWTAIYYSNLAPTCINLSELGAADSALDAAVLYLADSTTTNMTNIDWAAWAEYYNSRGLSFMNRKLRAEAESCFVASLNIKEGHGTHSISEVWRGKYSLANSLRDNGKYAKAESLYIDILSARRGKLGHLHRDIAYSLESLSRVYWLQEKQSAALDTAYTAVMMRIDLIKRDAAELSEPELLQYSNSLHISAMNFLAMAAHVGFADNKRVQAAAEVMLRTKGFVSDEVFGRGDDQSQTNSSNEPLLEQVRARVPRNSVLVEIYRLPGFIESIDTSIDHYLALVLSADSKPRISDLGRCSDIDSLVNLNRAMLEAVAESGHPPTSDESQPFKSLSATLNMKLIDPLSLDPGKTKLLFFAPDGQLNLLSFAGLVDTQGKYLIEKFTVHYFSAARDILRINKDRTTLTSLLALADPDFDAGASSRISTPQMAQIGTSLAKPTAARRALLDSCLNLRESKARPIPYTAEEARAVAASWTALGRATPQILTGALASEENLKFKAAGFSALYLATHGFYLDSLCAGIDAVAGGGTVRSNPENPLSNSGLLLAGANLAGAEAVESGFEDGILTAAEIAELDLRQTRLAVLSACESALGKVQDGEGVYGLRRAFLLAGAGTVVSSLWKIDDQSTAEMMGQLFAEKGQTIAERIRAIQLARIEKLRSDGRPDHPYSWGAFIATGDWR